MSREAWLPEHWRSERCGTEERVTRQDGCCILLRAFPLDDGTHNFSSPFSKPMWVFVLGSGRAVELKAKILAEAIEEADERFPTVDWEERPEDEPRWYGG